MRSHTALNESIVDAIEGQERAMSFSLTLPSAATEPTKHMWKSISEEEAEEEAEEEERRRGEEEEAVDNRGSEDGRVRRGRWRWVHELCN